MRKKKYDIAITASVMDMLHEGHVDLLRRMGKLAEIVIVIIHDDISTFLNKGRFPVQTVEHRAMNLRKSGLVNEVIITRDQNPIQQIIRIQLCRDPSVKFVFVRGDDWKNAPGISEIRKLMPVVFKPYLKGVSSTKRRAKRI